MFKVDRHEANDTLWVAMARKCISRRSEPLWEKLKNALGVPPELDDDEEEDLDAIGGEEMKPDLTAMGKGRTVDLGSAIDDGTDEESEDEEVEPISALGMTGLLMEGIYPSSDDASPHIPPMSGSPLPDEQFGFGGAEAGMEVIGEEEEEEKPTARHAEPPKVEVRISEDPTRELEVESHKLDPSRMVGLTIVSQSRKVPLQELMLKYDSDGGYMSESPVVPSSPSSERSGGNPLFPSNFANLTMTSSS